MNHQLSDGVTDDVARLQSEHANEGHHEKWVDQIGEGLGGVVDHDRPTQVDLQLIRSLHQIRCFDDPLSATGWNEKTEDSRIHTHECRISIVPGDRYEEIGNLMREREPIGHLSFGEDVGDTSVDRKLNQNSGNGRNGLADGIQKPLGSPRESHSQDQEQEIIRI